MSDKLVEWFRKMKYCGEIPESLESVYNSAPLVWDQLIANTKPREDVQMVRRNVIISLLLQKSSNKQNKFPFLIPEIDNHDRKNQLQERVSNLKKVIKEKQAKVEKMAQNNKIKYVAIERSKAQMKDNCEREYLLTKRSVILEENIAKSKEALSNLRSLTPVEVEENPNLEETTETLMKASEKIEEMLKKVPSKSEEISVVPKFVPRSVRKPPSSANFEKYFLMSESKLKSVVSVRKENTFFGLTSIENRESVKKCLFTSPSPYHNTKKPCSRAVFGKENTPISSKTKRESLGLVRDFELLSDQDPFLNINSNVVSSAISELREFDNNDDVFSLNAQECIDIVKNSYSTSKDRNSKDCDPIELLHKNKILNDMLVESLHSHDRQFIFETVQNLTETVHIDIMKLISTTNDISNKKVGRDELAKLRLTHIQIELDIKKQKRILKRITKFINERKNCIIETVLRRDLPKDHVDNKLRLLEQKLKDIATDSSLCAMKKQSLDYQSYQENNNLLIVSKKLTQLREDITTMIQNINQYIKMGHKIFNRIKRTRESTCAVVHTLSPFTSDLSWCSVFTQKVWMTENDMFEKFPLSYNRKCKHLFGDFPSYYRDLYPNSFSLDSELDDDHLFILSQILESPFSPPETIMLDILKAKKKLHIMQHAKTDVNIPHFKKYSFEELQQQESYIQFALDRLSTLLNSSSSQRTLSCVDFARKTMQIWVQMPFKNYVNPARLVKGQNYKSYEQRYDSFYNNI